MGIVPPKLDMINQLRYGAYSSFAMLAGMQLDVFTPLQYGPLSVDEIADATDVHIRKLRPLLYALVVAELLTVEDDLFSNTLESDHYLVRGKLSYIGGAHKLISSLYDGTLKTAESIRTGTPQANFDFFSKGNDEMFTFLRGIHADSVNVARSLLEHYDFSQYRRLLDVGGGSGGLAIALVESNPQLKATVIDLPLVTPFTQQFIDEADLTDRIGVMTADVVNGTLSGSFDLAVASKFTHCLSPDDVSASLNNIATILEPGGVIHLFTHVLDNSRLSPKEAVSRNLMLLNRYDGGEAYTEHEYHDWLMEVGFQDFERIALPNSPNSIVTARKPL